jgi:nucleotide-binding universal stress UspA family protein
MSRAKSILVAYDGSEAGRRALDAAADLMGYGSLLAVVGVKKTRSHEPLADASNYLSGRHVLARYLEGDGGSPDTLVDAAVEIGADVLVVAGLNGALTSVVRRAPCNVLVVR